MKALAASLVLVSLLGLGCSRTLAVSPGAVQLPTGTSQLVPSPAAGSGLIGQDGNGLIGQDGNGIAPTTGSGLIGQDGNGLVSNPHTPIISQDGNGLVGSGQTKAEGSIGASDHTTTPAAAGVRQDPPATSVPTPAPTHVPAFPTTTRTGPS